MDVISYLYNKNNNGQGNMKIELKDITYGSVDIRGNEGHINKIVHSVMLYMRDYFAECGVITDYDPEICGLHYNYRGGLQDFLVILNVTPKEKNYFKIVYFPYEYEKINHVRIRFNSIKQLMYYEGGLDKSWETFDYIAKCAGSGNSIVK